MEDDLFIEHEVIELREEEEKKFNTFEFIKSGKILPKKLQEYPYTKYIFISLAVLFVCLPIRIHVLLVVFGVIVGFVYASPSIGDSVDNIKFDFSFNLEIDNEIIKIPSDKMVSEQVDKALNELLRHLA